MNLLAAFLPLVVIAQAVSPSAQIRIGLFTLFKPEMLEVRVASSDGASLAVQGVAGALSIKHGDSILIRLSSGQLHIKLHGGRTLIATEARIEPAGSRALQLTLPGKISRAVRGELMVGTSADGRGPLRIVLNTGREAAVASVVAAESSRREMEALKALAVVVRTFMLAHPGRHSSEGFDFCDTTHCQFYRGEQDLSAFAASDAVERAVTATRGEFISYEGRAVEGYYTSACGGLTVTPSMLWGGSSNYPYRRVQCHWCRGSRFDRWERSAEATRVLDSLSDFTGARLSTSAELSTDHDRRSGFVQSVTIVDGASRSTLTADAFRRAIGLKLGWNTVLSATFTLERRGQRFIFRGRGFGSQIGLCEEGAIAQAAVGRTYREILSFYYPGTGVSETRSNE
jgi:stage II sporulation protein D